MEWTSLWTGWDLTVSRERSLPRVLPCRSAIATATHAAHRHEKASADRHVVRPDLEVGRAPGQPWRRHEQPTRPAHWTATIRLSSTALTKPVHHTIYQRETCFAVDYLTLEAEAHIGRIRILDRSGSGWSDETLIVRICHLTRQLVVLKREDLLRDPVTTQVGTEAS